ncbi:hypothetical protein WJX84_002333, partial [Apatococcus fuscideae]
MSQCMTQTHSSFTGLTLRPRQAAQIIRRTTVTRAAVTLPNPPFELDALESKGLSKATMEVHWGKHHRTYVDNLNKQLEGKPLADKPIEEIVKETWNNGSPAAEFNNAAQIWNHTFYWESMGPNGGGAPTGAIAEAINNDLGGFEEFKKQFTTAGATQFGSGWAWLVLDGGKLKVTKTANAENPLHLGQTPLLTMDVWEHAYYIDVQNRWPEYIGCMLSA